MTDYTAIDPQHYRDTPLGIDLECIEYSEVLLLSQGTAAKYIYRAGNKDPLEQDLKKALWYVKRARSKKLIWDIAGIDKDKLKTINSTATLRSLLFYLVVRGHLDIVETMLEQLIEDGAPLD